MSYGSYRQCSNGNFEPIEDYATLTCQRCGEELNPDQPMFEREQTMMCASCYLDSILRKEAWSELLVSDEDAAEKLADMLGDYHAYVDEIISDYAPDDLEAFC